MPKKASSIDDDRHSSSSGHPRHVSCKIKKLFITRTILLQDAGWRFRLAWICDDVSLAKGRCNRFLNIYQIKRLLISFLPFLCVFLLRGRKSRWKSASLKGVTITTASPSNEQLKRQSKWQAMLWAKSPFPERKDSHNYCVPHLAAREIWNSFIFLS